MTRFRCDANHVWGPLGVEYYAQRASKPGTLIIGEASLISPKYGSFPHAPGIYSDAQIQGWRAITDAVHKKGCFIMCQLIAPGRADRREAHTAAQDLAGPEMLSSSAVPITEGGRVPREMSVESIKVAVEDFAQAARNAIAAGFNGVEIHAANGYLIDQFTQDTCNRRTDEYGGSVEKRARFGLEVAAAVVAAIGADRVGIRLSPYSKQCGMGMKDPVPTFSHFVLKLKELKLACLHIVESRVSGSLDVDMDESIEWLMDIWKGTSPILVCGGYNGENARQALEGKYAPHGDVGVAFGRPYLANPDLPFRLRNGLPLNEGDRSTFHAKETPEGLIDYPFHPDYLVSVAQG